MNPKTKPPPVISSVAPPLELSGVFMPPNVSLMNPKARAPSVIIPPLELNEMNDDFTSPPDENNSVDPAPSQFIETDILMENMKSKGDVETEQNVSDDKKVNEAPENKRCKKQTIAQDIREDNGTNGNAILTPSPLPDVAIL